jgi:hypothetical protein
MSQPDQPNGMEHECSTLIDLAADLRKRAELSLSDLARQTGYSRWTLSRYEHGESNIPIGYVAVLAQQVIAHRQQQERCWPGDEARLLAELNAAIVPHYGAGRCHQTRPAPPSSCCDHPTGSSAPRPPISWTERLRSRS